MFTKSLSSNVEDIGELVASLAYVAEIKEWDNRAHVIRTSAYCKLLCVGMNIPRVESEKISVASQLHDIGKCTMPDELMQCKDEYKASEWVTVQNHTQVGGLILKGYASPLFRLAAVIAENHHERWDGSGYPNKLRGENIPLEARIYAVADTLDALTTPRVYKVVSDDLEAYNMIVKCDGILFDPKVIAVFKNIYSEFLKIKKISLDKKPAKIYKD
jgi:response regulator RpfG family c-di-GMP phosphodiesterase